MLSEQHRRLLRDLAYQSIRHGLETGEALNINPEKYPEELKQNRATFVTLHRNKELRGCIGILKPVRPLADDIAYNAWAAAFCDSRFAPLTAAELNGLDVHISILGTPETMHFSSEQDLVSQIRPGIDGLILEDGFNKGTFLPSVWESLGRAEEFLSQLVLKAGLPAGYWSDDLHMERYTTESFS